MRKLLVSILIYFIVPFGIYGQACCSSGTPLSAQLGLEIVAKGDLLFTLAYDYNYLDEIIKGTEELNSDDRSRLSQTIISRMQFGLSDRWSFVLSLPYVFRSENIQSEISSFSELSSSGIGDILFQTNYTLLSKKQQVLMLSVILKMPTGSNSKENNFGFPLPPDLQPGTGSWDGIISALYEVNNIWNGDFHFSLNGNARFNGDGTRFNVKQSYKFGNAFSIITGLSYEMLVKKSFLSPAINISYRRTLIDLTDDALTPNTGGDWLSIVPSISYTIYDQFMFLLSASIPVFRYLEGTQLTSTYSMFFQIQYTLKTIKNEDLLLY